MDLHFNATELRLGLPGTVHSTTKYCTKRPAAHETLGDGSSTASSTNSSSALDSRHSACEEPPVAKAQIVGWPPVRSYRKNVTLQSATKALPSNGGEALYVKVSMDGAPYLRKIDLKLCRSYHNLLEALGKMFKITIGKYTEKEGYDGSEYAPTYEDKDGDWMLVGDVPWEMFVSSCKRLRVMMSSEAKGHNFTTL